MLESSKTGRADNVSAAEIGDLLFHTSAELLERLLDHPALNEEHLLTLLSRKNLPRSVLPVLRETRIG